MLQRRTPPFTSLAWRQLRHTLGRIGFIEKGDGEATPIIFLHGVGSDKSVWRPQLDLFGQERRAVAFDYPGYGESEFRDDATRDDFAAAISPRWTRSASRERMSAACR